MDVRVGLYRKLSVKNWCFWTVVFEKTLESPWDYKEIQPIHPKGNQPWIFIGSTDTEAEPPILWPPDAKSWLIWKDPDPGKDWVWDEKGMTEDEMVRWHHQLNGHEFEWTLGAGDGQGGLACCSPQGHKRGGHDWATELMRWIFIYSCLYFNMVALTYKCVYGSCSKRNSLNQVAFCFVDKLACSTSNAFRRLVFKHHFPQRKYKMSELTIFLTCLRG